MSVFSSFCLEEDAFVLSSEALLLGAVVVLGLIVGLNSIQHAVVLELSDYATSIGILNQSYEYTGVSDDSGSTQGSLFADTLDSDEAVLPDLIDETEEPDA